MRDPRRMLEADLQSGVLDLAARMKWRRAHFRPGRVMCPACHGHATEGRPRACPACRGKGYSYRTPVEGDGQGWPDLVMVRRDRLIVAELKSDDGTVDREQLAWLDAFEAVTKPPEVYVWRPDGWRTGAIEERLR